MSLISSISGVLFSKSPSEAILDVGGIRFLLHISFATYEILPDKGNSVDILTHLHVKEDILDLNTNQALVPSKAKVIRNRLGTAPGLFFQQKNQAIF